MPLPDAICPAARESAARRRAHTPHHAAATTAADVLPRMPARIRRSEPQKACAASRLERVVPFRPLAPPPLVPGSALYRRSLLDADDADILPAAAAPPLPFSPFTLPPFEAAFVSSLHATYVEEHYNSLLKRFADPVVFIADTKLPAFEQTPRPEYVHHCNAITSPEQQVLRSARRDSGCHAADFLRCLPATMSFTPPEVGVVDTSRSPRPHRAATVAAPQKERY